MGLYWRKCRAGARVGEGCLGNAAPPCNLFALVRRLVRMAAIREGPMVFHPAALRSPRAHARACWRKCLGERVLSYARKESEARAERERLRQPRPHIPGLEERAPVGLSQNADCRQPVVITNGYALSPQCPLVPNLGDGHRVDTAGTRPGLAAEFKTLPQSGFVLFYS